MTNALDRISQPNLPSPGHIGQATAVEQSRAVAEVHAAIVVAQQVPRNIQLALRDMRESCAQKGLAERAFYRYSRAGGSVTGESVHLARELARCWGNIQYGISELRRDDAGGYSEMQAYAWDVQTNTRSTQVFVVPHKRDVKGGPKALVDLRDIYENNANNGARRLRQAIFSVLPPWFTEEAKELCQKTLADGGGVPLARRVADAIKAFEGVGITVDQLEQKLDRKTAQWTDHDVAQLSVTFRSLQRGEVTREEEFPAQRVTAADVTAAQPQSARPAVPAAAQPEVPVSAPPANSDGGMSDAQSRKMFACFRDAARIEPALGDRDGQLAYIAEVIGRKIQSRSELTAKEGAAIIDALEAFAGQNEPPAGESR